MRKHLLMTLAVALTALLSSCTKTETVLGDYQVSVTFNALEGAFVNGQQTLDTVINAGTKISEPTEKPTREGYVFGGWCSDSECLTPVTFPAPVNNDKVYYAKWLAPGPWRMSGITLETYAALASLPESIMDITYSFGEGGKLDSIGIVKMGGECFSINFIGDSIRIPAEPSGRAAGAFKMEDGRFSSLSFVKQTDSFIEFLMKYDEGGYMSEMFITEKVIGKKTEIDTIVFIRDISVENGSYSRCNFSIIGGLLSNSPMSVSNADTVEGYVAYQNSAIFNTSQVSAWSPAVMAMLFLGVGSDKLMDESNGGLNYVMAIMLSPCFGTESALAPRIANLCMKEGTVEAGMNAVMMADDWAEIDPETGNITQLGYYLMYDNGLNLFKYRYEPYTPSN